MKSAEPTKISPPVGLDAASDGSAEDSASGSLPPPQAVSSRAAIPKPAPITELLIFIVDSIWTPGYPDRRTRLCRHSERDSNCLAEYMPPSRAQPGDELQRHVQDDRQQSDDKGAGKHLGVVRFAFPETNSRPRPVPELYAAIVAVATTCSVALLRRKSPAATPAAIRRCG